MTLAELIARFRVEANDKVAPYFVSDDEVRGFLNEAQREACVRGRLIHEALCDSICRVNVAAGTPICRLHEALYEITYSAFKIPGWADRHPVRLVSPEWLDGHLRDWRESTGTPRFAVQTDKALRLVPMPDVAGTLLLEGYRLPRDELEDKEDEPEIKAAHHVHLVQWALHKAFSIPDAEFFDANRAAQAVAAFEAYFGARPDSNLRRATREDVPQHVEAFWV